MPDGWAKVGTEWRRLHGEEALWLSVWLSAGAGGWITYHPHSFPTVSENSPWEIVLSSLHTWPSLSILLCFTFPPPPPPLFFFFNLKAFILQVKNTLSKLFWTGLEQHSTRTQDVLVFWVDSPGCSVITESSWSALGVSTNQGVFSFFPSRVCPHINHNDTIISSGRRGNTLVTGAILAIFSH